MVIVVNVQCCCDLSTCGRQDANVSGEPSKRSLRYAAKQSLMPFRSRLVTKCRRVSSCADGSDGIDELRLPWHALQAEHLQVLQCDGERSGRHQDSQSCMDLSVLRRQGHARNSRLASALTFLHAPCFPPAAIALLCVLIAVVDSVTERLGWKLWTYRRGGSRVAACV